MTDQQKYLKEHFLESETRDGYFVDAKMKAAWKVMLDITEEIARICDKHGLQYSMAAGTLLGAVRHKGFIPWDDDVDLHMPRKDYDRFLEIAEMELRPPFVLQTFYTDFERTSGFAQIRNPLTTGIDKTWVRLGLRFNMGIGVDVFPIDGIPETASAERRTRIVLRFVQGIVNARAVHCKRGLIGRCKTIAAKVLFGLIGPRRLWRMRERAYARNDMQKCTLCGEYTYQMDNPSVRWSPRCHDSYVVMPFEYLELKAPVGYEEILDAKYNHNWREPSRSGGGHSALVMDADTPYKKTLVEQFNYKPEWVRNLP